MSKAALLLLLPEAPFVSLFAANMDLSKVAKRVLRLPIGAAAAPFVLCAAVPAKSLDSITLQLHVTSCLCHSIASAACIVIYWSDPAHSQQEGCACVCVCAESL